MMTDKAFQRIAKFAQPAKLVTLAIWWFPQVSVAGGIGSQSWWQDYGAVGDTTEGMRIVVLLLALLAITSVLILGSKKVRIILAITIGIPMALCIANNSPLFGFLAYPMFFVALWVSDRVNPPSVRAESDLDHSPRQDVTTQAPSMPLRTTIRSTPSTSPIAAEKKQRVIAYVGNKTASEIIRLAGTPTVKNAMDIPTTVRREDPPIQHVGASTSRKAASIKPTITGTRPLSFYRNQLCDPVNVLRLNCTLNSIPESPGFAVVSGESRIRNIVVYGSNVQVAVRGFLGWATTVKDPEWDHFLSHGFSPAILATINSKPENVGKEHDLAISENTRLDAMVRSRCFDGATGAAYISEEFSVVKTLKIEAPLLSVEKPSQSIQSEGKPSGSKCVDNSNSAEIKKVLPCTLSEEKLLETNTRLQNEIVQPDSQLIEIVNEAASSRTPKKEIATPFPNLRGLAWIKECASFYADDIDYCGSDLVEFFGRQSDRTHWHMHRKCVDFEYLSELISVNFTADIEDFSYELVALAKRIAQHYFNDHEWLYDGRFREPICFVKDVEMFGVDLVVMAEKAISFTYATQLMKDIQPLQFCVGTKVLHKAKGAAFGIGEILNRNDQYLTVEFPTVQKRFELITKTACDYLAETPKDLLNGTSSLPKSIKPGENATTDALMPTPMPSRSGQKKQDALVKIFRAQKALQKRAHAGTITNKQYDLEWGKLEKEWKSAQSSEELSPQKFSPKLKELKSVQPQKLGSPSEPKPQ